MSAYYHTIYLLLLTILSLVVIPQYNKYSKNRILSQDKTSYSSTIILCILIILFIGFRNPYAPEFGDSQAYSRTYDHIIGDIFLLNWDIQNPLFYTFLYLFASLRLPVSIFYLFIALIYFGGICYACIKFFPKDSFVAFVVYLAAFSTYTFSINGIKAAAAASLFLVAICLNHKKVKIWPWVFLALSIGFHHSMRVSVIAFFMCKFIKAPKFYTYLWIICFFIAALHITYFQLLFSSFGDEKAEVYLGTKESYIETIPHGFRIDFILYSVMPILLGWYGIYKKRIQSKSYEFLLNLYTFINAIWMLCIYASFTNRIAYLSWLMYPIVLIYPLLKEDWGIGQYKLFKNVAILHLAFTLFMTFIYY